MIKLFASDLDGTLLGSNHQISQRTAQAIKDLQARGIEFMVATGRDRYSCLQLIKAAGIECATINLNGAIIYQADGLVSYRQSLSLELYHKLVQAILNDKLDYSVMADDHFYVADVEAFYRRVSSYLGQNHHPDDHTNAQLSDQFGNIKALDQLDLEKSSIYKLMIMSSQPLQLHQFRAEWQDHPKLDITASGPDNLEITHKDAQKGLAIQKYIQDKGYTMDQVATIGDSLNDRSMLKMAGYSYAMSNATDAVKGMAKYIAPPNDEDGVAQIIETIIQSMKGK